MSGAAQTAYPSRAFAQNVDGGPKPAAEALKVFIKNLAERLPDSLLESLLGEFGVLTHFRRTRNERGEPVSFAIAEFGEPAGLINCWRILNKYKLADKTVEVVINQHAKGLLADFVEELRRAVLAERPTLAPEQLEQELTARLARDDAAILERISRLLGGFERNKDAIVKAEKKTGHRLYTEEKLNSHKQKYGLRNARELEELFIKELKAWLEKDAQFRAQRERELETEKHTHQRKQQLLAEALASKAEPPRDARRQKACLKLIAADLAEYGLDHVLGFLGLEPSAAAAAPPSAPPSEQQLTQARAGKRPKRDSVSADASPVAEPATGPLFTRVEVAAGEVKTALALPPPARGHNSELKAIGPPEKRAALAFAASLFKSPAALQALQEKVVLERVKQELVRNHAKLKALLDLRKSIPRNTRALFGMRLRWEELEGVR